jgi:hypothetical protein
MQNEEPHGNCPADDDLAAADAHPDTSGAAARLGMKRTTLQSYVKRLAIVPGTAHGAATRDLASLRVAAKAS